MSSSYGTPLWTNFRSLNIMAATPFSTAVSNSLSLVNATTTNADAPRSDPLGPPSRIARRTRRRSPPTPSLAPAGSSLPTIQPNVAAVSAGAPRPGAGRRRLAAPVCYRCNGQGKCKNCVCVKQGRVYINCLPSRVGGCQNLDVPALPSAPSPVRLALHLQHPSPCLAHRPQHPSPCPTLHPQHPFPCPTLHLNRSITCTPLHLQPLLFSHSLIKELEMFGQIRLLVSFQPLLTTRPTLTTGVSSSSYQDLS